MSPDKVLFLSDDYIFYTLEGEGQLVGRPSVFMRMSMCNLTCIGFASPDSPFGCDSFISWSKKNKMTLEEVAQYFEKTGYHDRLRAGAVLKITGGEPLIQEKNLLEFVKMIIERWEFVDYNKPLTPEDVKKPVLYIDFETNATLMPSDEWAKFCVTYTTSPKLSNNGDPENKRFKPEVLKFLVQEGACFKFVVKQESDLIEIFDKYINNSDIKLPQDLVWLMPMCGSRQELTDVGLVVAELCKKYGFNYSNRLQLQLWNKALKV